MQAGKSARFWCSVLSLGLASSLAGSEALAEPAVSIRQYAPQDSDLSLSALEAATGFGWHFDLGLTWIDLILGVGFYRTLDFNQAGDVVTYSATDADLQGGNDRWGIVDEDLLASVSPKCSVPDFNASCSLSSCGLLGKSCTETRTCTATLSATVQTGFDIRERLPNVQDSVPVVDDPTVSGTASCTVVTSKTCKRTCYGSGCGNCSYSCKDILTIPFEPSGVTGGSCEISYPTMTVAEFSDGTRIGLLPLTAGQVSFGNDILSANGTVSGSIGQGARYTYLGTTECGSDADCGNDSRCATCVPNQYGTMVCQFAADGTNCNDDTVCNGAETCVAGDCAAGAPLDCGMNDGDLCHEHSCDAQSGCDTVATNPCDDGVACTLNVCNADKNACEYVPDDAQCGKSDDPCKAYSCSLVDGCVLIGLTGGACDDDNACSTSDVCQDGECVGTNFVSCADNDCNTSQCDPGTGECVLTPANEGGSCEDGGSFCGGYKTCGDGACGLGAAADCDDANPCTEDSCPDGATQCVHEAIEGCCVVDEECADADACTLDERCEDNKCVSDPQICDDGNLCTTDSCDPAFGCAYIDNQEPCEDGNPCTLEDRCGSGECVPGNVRDCTDLSTDCVAGMCDPGSGQCVGEDLEAGRPCTSDEDACNGTESCDGQGSCVHGAALACDDGQFCTTDACDPVQGCTHAPVDFPCCEEDSACSDTDLCTQNERCDGHACKADPVSCDDANPCTGDVCDPATGCAFTFNGCPFVDAACPCVGPARPWKNHGEYVSCIAHQANLALAAGYIDDFQHSLIVSGAAQSTCGGTKR